MPSGILLSVVLLLVILLVLVVGSQFIRRAARAPRTLKVEPIDASHWRAEPPAPTQPVIAELRGLGFERVGEAALNPTMPGPTIWYLTDSARTTCAGVFDAQGTGVAVIYSWFGADEAVQVTGFPAGTTIDDPDFRFHTVQTSAADAYRHHLEGLADFATRYGPPLRLDSMSEILRLDRLYNQRFAPRRQRAPTFF